MPKVYIPNIEETIPITDEFVNAEINDRRLVKRLCHTAEKLAEHPEQPISSACGPWHDVKAAYGFFDNDKVNCEGILAGHRQCTIERMKAYKIVLDIQDTTSLDYNTHRTTEGLGPTNGSAESLGLKVHTALAVTTDGVPLGVLAMSIWARDPAEHGKRDQRKQKATDDKESNRWLVMMDKSLAGIPEGILIVTVTDREGDIFDFAAKAVAEAKHLLFRVAQNRRTDSEQAKLFTQVATTPVLGRCQIDVPRKPASKQPSRQAHLSIRACRVRIFPPLKRTSERLQPITLYAVEAKEENPPKGVEALHWLLLTTLPVLSLQDAMEKIGWYRNRWKIERFHYILKSGCRIEDLRLETKERLERAITLYAVIAWRIAWMTYQARENPALPCSVAFSKMEWQALWRQVYPRKRLPGKPPPLKDAVRWLAMLGGFLGRKSDGDPGVKVLWNGMRDLNIGIRFLENS